MSALLDKLNRILTETEMEQRNSDAKFVADSLSGTFGKPIRVKEWIEGGLRALVPVEDLRSSGIVVTKSLIEGIAPIIAGSENAVQNAERRIAKRLGEAWTVKLVDFDPTSQRVAFAVSRGVQSA
jgi:hypothetical protein